MLTVDRLSKTYPSFALQDVSFELPAGYITGFIGVNGAGKTTTLKSIMNIVRPDSGNVRFHGQDLHAHEADAKQRIGYMLGPIDVYPKQTARRVVNVYSRFYTHWDADVFARYMDRFRIDGRKRITDLSTGMRVKLGIAMALSHGAEVILLDEPTSGLDPVARDELLELLGEVVDDGQRSVLYSTHITSDLDKSADFVVFIRDGRIIANDTKDDLLAGHLLVRGGTDDLTTDLQDRLVGNRENAFGFTGLARRQDLDGLLSDRGLQTARPDLETLMLYYDSEAHDDDRG